MRTLHVAALPFPSMQGTQALLHAMLTALAQAGHDTHLLCYPHGAFERAHSYSVHRGSRDPRTTSLRSGPSAGKILEDISLASDLRALLRSLRPERVFAHHVEAAACAYAAGVPALAYVAHTSVATELGSYFPRLARVPWGLIGAGADLLAALPAKRHLAISPLLCAELSARAARPFELLRPPWFVQAPITVEERRSARAALGLATHSEILLYAGNLDAYQGLDVLYAGLLLAFAQRPHARFLLATASDTALLLKKLPTSLTARTLLVTLDSDEARRRVHAAADLALVPRRSPGGLPIKLLDAMSLGLPVLACARATAGFEFGPACHTLADDEPSAWAEGIARYFDLSSEHRRAFSEEARAWIADQHGPQAFVRQLLAAGG